MKQPDWLGDFYVAHQGLLFALARECTRTWEDAEDLVQETLMRISRLSEEPTTTAFLRLLTRRSFSQRYARGKRHDTYPEQPVSLDGLVGLQVRSPLNVERQVMARLELQAIAATRPDVIAYACGYTAAEAGRRYGISGNTVKQHLFRVHHSRAGGLGWRKHALLEAA